MGKQKPGNKAAQESAEVHDPRFAGLHTDPRFIRPKKRDQKVVLDDRFKSVFEGEDGKGRVDRFGRKVAKSAAQNELRRFYRIEDGDGKKRAGPGDKDFIDFARGQIVLESSDEEDEDEAEADQEDSESEDGEVELGPSRIRRQREVSIDLDESAPFAFLDEPPSDGPPVEPTSRVAVVDMDWDHLRAADLFQVFASLLSLTAPPLAQLPPKREFVADENGELVKGVREVHRVAKGRVVRVAIYKSSFGKERMAKEDVEGPPAEIFKNGNVVAPPSETDGSDDDDEGGGMDDGDSVSDLFREDEQQDYDEDALRQYQLDRLRYHYAIVTLDSVDAAKHVYEEVEGSEFERTANIFDLSYVPENMTFEESDLRDECLEERSDYKGVDYVTDALRHSRVKLTWDAEDPHRAKVTRLNTQKLSRDELAAVDYDAFIAPPSSDEDDGEGESGAGKVDQAKRERMRKLMGLDVGAKEDAGGEMEITFAPALDEAGRKEEESSLDVYKRKEKERRQRKKGVKSGVVEGERAAADDDGGFDDDFFKGIDDRAAFAARDAGSVPSDEQDERPEKKNKLGREERKAAKAEADRQRAELAEALGSEDESGGEGGKHFNMNDIVKAEKLKGKKKRKGAKAKRLGELKDDFAIDAGDERFKSVFEEADFAIDPSNPHFKKTKSMDKLLQTGQKRRAEKRERDEQERDRRKAEGKKPAGTDSDRGLSSLVASLKRKSRVVGTGAESNGKRRKA